MVTGARYVCFFFSFLAAQMSSGIVISGDSPGSASGDGRLLSAAVDGSGVVWGILTGAEAKLATWQENHFTPIDSAALLNPALKYGPEYVFSMSNGDVVVYWRSNSSRLSGFTRHRGAISSRVASDLSMADTPGGIAWDENGRLWIATASAGYRIDEAGALVTVATWSATDFFPPQTNPPPNRIIRRAPKLAADSTGEVWAWGASWPPDPRVTSLAHVYHMKAHSVEPLLTTDLPQNPVSAFAPKADQSAWLAMSGEGLFDLNLASGKARRVDDPAPHAFQYVTQITKSGDAWYVVAAPDLPERVYDAKNATLWALRGGVWSRLLDGLDVLETERPIEHLSDALWVGGVVGGVWRIPDGGPPELLDWRNGIPLQRAGTIRQLDGGRVLAIRRSGGEDWAVVVCASVAEWLAQEPPAKNVTVFGTRCKAVQDQTGTLWVVRDESPGALSAWDGVAWKDSQIPNGIGPSESVHLSVDDAARIWVWKRRYHPENGAEDEAPVAVYSPQNGQWETFETWAKALESKRQMVSEFYNVSDMFPVARFSKDKRVTYKEYSGRYIRYFDGDSWQKFDRDTFEGKPRFEDSFFSGNGKLMVTVRRYIPDQGTIFTNYEFDGKNWTKAPEAKAPLTPFEKTRAATVAKFTMPKPFSQSWQKDCIIEGAYGLSWFWYMDRGQPMKSSPLGAAPQIKPGEVSPLLSCREVWSAALDRAGAAFLEVEQYNRYAIVTASAVPKTQLHVSAVNDNSFEVKLDAAPSKALLYLWRLDNGAWNSLRDSASLRFDQMLGGDYLLQVACVDEALQVEQPPAEAHLTVSLEPAKQVETWIGQLSSDDYDIRKAAIRALSQRPDLSQPALRAAREKASPDLQWWIDATLQAIESKGNAQPGAH